MKLSTLTRLLQIERIFMRFYLDEFFTDTSVEHVTRLLAWLHPFRRLNQHSRRSRGTRLREALIALGPIYIKFGQVLSTRRDLLPADIADELAQLQDRVPPFDSTLAQNLIETALGAPLSSNFQSFEVEPLAAASIAQVHGATLHDGREVIVKVLRPGVEAEIRADIAVLRAIAQLLLRFVKESERLRPVEVVEEYEKTIHDELDLQREAANAAQLRRNFADSELLYVPEVHFNLTRRNVMVMERIRGIQISNLQALRERGVNFKALAENGVQIFFTQMLTHNFFHADMHPGNIFVLADDPEKPRYAAIDFGIVGTLDQRDLEYIAGNFLAFFDRDYRRIAELHIDSGWVPHDTRADEMESAIRTVCEPIFNKPLSEISYGTLLLRLFETAQRFKMTVQPQLILLQKTLLNIEGLGRELYPELDLWATAQPLLKRWRRQYYGPRRFWREFKRHAPTVVSSLSMLPDAINRFLLAAQTPNPAPASHEAVVRAIYEAQRRHDQTMLCIAGVFLGALMWLVSDNWDWAGALLVLVSIVGLLTRRRRVSL
jgi:ubiquinone biosynthesis protein